MPRKSSRASGSSPDKAATVVTPARRATRGRGQKAEDSEDAVNEIPAHLLRGSDESSEQSDNDSDYGSPKKGRGRGGGATGRGRGRKTKEVVYAEEKLAPSRGRRGRKAKAQQLAIAEELESEQFSQEEVHSQTTGTGDERDETTQESEHVVEDTPIEEVQAPPIVEQQQEEEEEVVTVPLSPEPPQQQIQEEPVKEQEIIQEQQFLAEKVSEVEQELQSNNDQAPVNEEDDKKSDVDEVNEKEEKKIEESDDEVSKDAPELPHDENESNQSVDKNEESKIRSRSSSGEIHENICEKIEEEEVRKVPVKAPTPKKSSPVKEVRVDEPKTHQRKRKWGARKADNEPVIAITTDSLKNVISEEIKPVPLSDVKLITPSPEREPEEKRPRTKPTMEEKDAKKNLLKERLRKQQEEEERRDEILERRQASPNIVVTNGSEKGRKVALVHEEVAVIKPLSPPKNQTSKYLFITNLQRPLTTVSLRSLLSRTGVVEDLWVDSIKSKCYVKFATEDQAYETRQALHGVKWPEHNVKKLNVEFSTEEEMNKVAQPAVVDRDIIPSADTQREAKSGGFGWSKADVQKSPDDRKTSRRTREWDVGKRNDAEWDQRDENRRRRRSSERENRRERERKNDEPLERKRSVSLSLAAEEKNEAENASPPGRLLDDLFRKTKAVPCIYWLPLTEEQVNEKEEQRQKNLAEHKRRMEEMIKQQNERREAREQRNREREQRDRKRSRSSSRGARRRRSRSNSRGGRNRNRFDRR